MAQLIFTPLYRLNRKSQTYFSVVNITYK